MMASLTITDGERMYRTVPVKVTATRAANAGVWTEALTCEAGRFGACRAAEIGQANRSGQVFDNFHLQAIDRIPVDPNDNIVVLNAWRAPMLPISQDCVLVLER